MQTTDDLVAANPVCLCRKLRQVVALTVILLAFQLWRPSGTFIRGPWVANLAIMAAGFTLFGYQITACLTSLA
jgi:hypothetical protein